MDPLTALRRIAFLLERTRQPTHRVQAFRRAAALVAADRAAVEQRAMAGTLTDLPGIGPATSAVIIEALRGEIPRYLIRLQDSAPPDIPLTEAAAEVLAALRGDLHTHSNWSDGGSPIEEMAVTAAELGREYTALTDHSPRLRVANGLTAERLIDQLAVVDQLKPRLVPYVQLSGIEVDILDDGSLDQRPELLARLDIVVASVHSKLRMEREPMTRRMLAAIADPHSDVLGHCTGRLVGAVAGSATSGSGATGPSTAGADPHARGSRPQSTFDAEAVFAQCARYEVAVEINCRPERMDPPEDLLRLAVAAGCLFSLDTDAHAPGQLDWLAYGCQRVVDCAVPVDRIVTTWPVHKVLEWSRRAR